MFKRVFLFVATNLAVLVVLSVAVQFIMPLLGLNPERIGLDVTSLLVFAAILGFGGAFISLAISKWMAKMTTGAIVIDTPRDATEQWLIETVRRQAKQAGIGMPDVAVYAGPEINAFATGMNRNHALVAVSTGLLQSMSREEAEAVLAHEVSHIANGDMVTMALLQGVLNTFVIAISRVIGYAVDTALRGNRNDSQEGPGIGFFVASLIAQIVLGILASLVVMWFSRRREFRADAGGAKLAGREKMVAALEKLRRAHEPSTLPSQMAAFGINGDGNLKKLFMSHPPLEERIAALQQRQ